MTSEDLSEYLKLHSPTDEKGRYLHFHDFRYRVAKGLNIKLAWSVVKSARDRQMLKKTWVVHIILPHKF